MTEMLKAYRPVQRLRTDEEFGLRADRAEGKGSSEQASVTQEHQLNQPGALQDGVPATIESSETDSSIPTQPKPESLPTLHPPYPQANKKGSTGPEVLVAKTKLRTLHGVSDLSDTDEYDVPMYKKVRAFQWKFGLPPDGTIGTNTWRMILGSPTLEIDDPSATLESSGVSSYNKALEQGQQNRREHGEWGDTPPQSAKPGEYGDTWCMGATVVRVGGDLNWRYNNPGNILPGYKQHSFGGYAHALNVAALSGLAIFPSWDVGWDSLRNLLLSQIYKGLTLKKAFEKYVGTPFGKKSAFGDDPEAYLKSVTGQTGLNANDIVGDLNDTQLDGLMKAIRHVEGTREGKEYKPGDSLPPNLAHVFG